MRLLLTLFVLIPVTVQADISVVASIRPLYQITAALTQGVASPVLLIGDSESAHHFSFRPSHFRTLQQADLVIWVDREFEGGFQQLPEILPGGIHQLELIPTLGLDSEDGHIWYSPEILILLSTEISRVVAELDPDNRLIYQQNLSDFHRIIKHWEREVRQIVNKKEPAVILDHDFLHHFETAFGLQPFAAIHNHHDQHRGISSLQVIEEKIKTSSVKCIIGYEHASSRTARNLAEQYSLSIRPIKSFADDGDPATRFARHLISLTNILRDC